MHLIFFLVYNFMMKSNQHCSQYIEKSQERTQFTLFWHFIPQFIFRICSLLINYLKLGNELQVFSNFGKKKMIKRSRTQFSLHLKHVDSKAGQISSPTIKEAKTFQPFQLFSMHLQNAKHGKRKEKILAILAHSSKMLNMFEIFHRNSRKSVFFYIK